MVFPYRPKILGIYEGDEDSREYNRQELQLARISGSSGPSYYVDPDNADGSGIFATINDAYATANSELGAGEPLLITLAPSKTHQLSSDLVLAPGRTCAIQNLIREPERNDQNNGSETEIVGNIILSPNDANSRRKFVLSNITMLGDIFGDSNWDINLNELGLWQNRLYRTHGTNGCRLVANRCYANSGSFRVLDADAAAGGWLSMIQIYNSRLQCELSTDGGKSEAMFDLQGDVWFDILNCEISLLSISGTPIFIPCLGLGMSLTIMQTTIYTTDYGGGGVSIFNNSGSSGGRLEDLTISARSGMINDIGVLGGYYSAGRGKAVGTAAPTSPPTGMEWVDQTAFAHKMWNGMAWV